MDKDDNSDIIDDTMDDLLVIRKYNNFPGSFTKTISSLDNVISISRLYSAYSYGFITDNIYGAQDDFTTTDWSNRIPLNTSIYNDPKWLSYGANFSHHRVLGVKISGSSICTESPFSGTAFTRIQYPPLHLALVYDPGVPAAALSANQFVNCDTSMIIYSDGNEHSKCFLLPVFKSAKYTTTKVIPSLGFHIYVGGFLVIPSIDIVASEAYQFVVTTYIELKDYDGIQHI